MGGLRCLSGESSAGALREGVKSIYGSKLENGFRSARTKLTLKIRFLVKRHFKSHSLSPGIIGPMHEMYVQNVFTYFVYYCSYYSHVHPSSCKLSWQLAINTPESLVIVAGVPGCYGLFAKTMPRRKLCPNS